MTCQHCQTWILDDDHRCPRCARRVRATPSRISPATYPIAATATARAYDFEVSGEANPAEDAVDRSESEQQTLFANPQTVARVIPFSSLMSQSDRDAIRLRAEEERPAPVKTVRVDSKRARAKRNESSDQHHLAFPAAQEIPAAAGSTLCDVPVATAGIRIQSALIDALIMGAGCGLGALMFFYVGGRLGGDKHLLPFVLAALFTVPLLYKLLWAFAGQDTIGTQMAGLELVDFDGRRPTRHRRFQRLFGSVLSLLAAGIGMVWALVDQDKLTWHDHISGTFPTFSSEVR